MTDRYDGFAVNLLQDNSDDWVAHFLELPSVSACGDTPEEALLELDTAWEAMKESYAANNEAIPVAPTKKEYSGQFNIRIDKRVHRELAIEAARVGLSLNALVGQKLLSTVRQPGAGLQSL